MRSLHSALVALCAIAIVALTPSCSSNNTGPDGGAQPGTIVATVNGRTFTTLTMTTNASQIEAAGITTLMIQGNTGGTSSDAITLSVVGINGTGTYPIGGGPNIANIASYSSIKVDMSNPGKPEIGTWQAPYNEMKVGEIVITELTESVVKGTFYFDAKNTGGDGSVVKITSGAFNIEFTK